MGSTGCNRRVCSSRRTRVGRSRLSDNLLAMTRRADSIVKVESQQCLLHLSDAELHRCQL